MTTTIIKTYRTDISNAPTVESESPFSPEITEALEAGRISYRQALRLAGKA